MYPIWPQRFWMKRVSNDPAVQAEYNLMRMKGVSHNLAEMLALGTPPANQDDTRFMSGHVNHNQFDYVAGRLAGENALREAKEAGVSVEGARYCGGLASYPGDPTAWIRSRADVRRVAAEKGMTIEGTGVNYTPTHEVDLDD